MSMHKDAGHRIESQGSFLSSRSGLVLLAFLAIAGILLFTEHRAHVLPAHRAGASRGRKWRPQAYWRPRLRRLHTSR